MELEIWRGDWGVPSVDLECLRVLTYIKFIGVPLKVKETSNPFWTPKGYLPIFRDGRITISNFEDLVSHLKSQNISTDLHLDTKQQTEVWAFTQFLKEKLYPALKYMWWVDEKNYAEVARPVYAKALRIPFNFYYPPKYQAEAKDMIDALYGENCDLQFIERAIYEDGEKCLSNLSDRLGDSEYFFGSKPSSFDATVFAYLALILKPPFPNASLQNTLKTFPNLVKFVNKISHKNFKGITEEFTSFQSKNKSTGSQSDKDASEFPNQTRNKILAAVFAAIAMTGYAIANGLFQVNFKDEYNNSNEYNDMFENEEDDH